MLNPKLLEPTLLWSNNNPNNAFSNQDAILNQDTSNFKYLVIEWKNYMGNVIGTSDGNKTRGSNITKLDNNVGYGYMLFEGSENYRILFIKSKTIVHFDDTTSNFTSPNQLIIPVAIYGTNIL